MKTVISARSDRCVIHRVEVTNDGKFHDPGRHSAKKDEEFWKILQESVSSFSTGHVTVPYTLKQKRAPNVRVRALFVENISVPVLQMLGTKLSIFTTVLYSSSHIEQI